MTGGDIQIVDIREILDDGGDPLSHVLDTLERIGPNVILEVIAPFEPRLLCKIMEARGYQTRLKKLEGHLWSALFQPGAGTDKTLFPIIADLRRHPPDDLLNEVNSQIAKLRPGQVLILQTLEKLNGLEELQREGKYRVEASYSTEEACWETCIIQQ